MWDDLALLSSRFQASCKRGYFLFAALGVSRRHLKLFLLSAKWGDWAQQEACYNGRDVLVLLGAVTSPGCLFAGLLS